MTTPRNVLATVLAATLLGGCALLGGPDERRESGTDDPATFAPETSLTDEGMRLAEAADLEDTAPSYLVTADVTPSNGKVTGTVEAELPVGAAADSLSLRFFPALPDFDTGAEIGRVTVDGDEAGHHLDRSIVTVELPAVHAERVSLVVPFSYALGLSEGGGGILDALGGMGGPAEVGLLSRHADALNLGHWFPVWVPAGNSADPDPAGYGDIGNFPAALMRLRLTVPEGWTVVDGGVRTSRTVTDGNVTVGSEGYGMNDMVVSLLRGYASRSERLDGALEGVTVTAYGPKKDAGQVRGVLDETVAALEVLSSRLTPYPWREFDVVSAPLGAGVGGMEWPGATWIEPSLFAGGIPGLGDLGDLLGGTGLEGLDLEQLLGGDALGGLGGDLGQMVVTMRPWTIAHEVGHEWWHIVVGNDSVLDPVVDEPLAQYSACIVLRQSRGADADGVCDAQIDSAYEQMRMLGDQDAPAARATDEFATSGQYAGVVYGKAAAFYRALERPYGEQAVVDALGAVAREHAFSMLTSSQLRDALAGELGERDTFLRLWNRWMEGTRGDTDLGVDGSAGRGALDGLQGLDGLGDGEVLDELLGELLAQ